MVALQKKDGRMLSETFRKVCGGACGESKIRVGGACCASATFPCGIVSNQQLCDEKRTY